MSYNRWQLCCCVTQARVDDVLRSNRPTSRCGDLALRDSASDDVELRHSRRNEHLHHHHRHRGRHHDDDDVAVSRTRKERARLGLRDKLDELRLQDVVDVRKISSDTCVPSHSSDATMAPPRRTTSPGLVTSIRNDMETSSRTSAAADDGGDGDGDEKPVKTLLDDTEVEMTSKSSSTSRWFNTDELCRRPDDLSTTGISHATTERDIALQFLSFCPTL